MKKFNNSKISIAIMLAVFSNASLAIKINPDDIKQANAEQSSINNSVVRKHAPEVTLDIVQEQLYQI